MSHAIIRKVLKSLHTTMRLYNFPSTRNDFDNSGNFSRFFIRQAFALFEKCSQSEFFWSAFSRIQSECRKIQTGKSPNTDSFHGVIGGDYVISFFRDEISTSPAGIDFTLRLHEEINFHPGKAGQVSRYLLAKTHRFPLI